MRLDELTEPQARAVARWRYPSPYDCYDFPPWEQMADEGWAICDPCTRVAQFRALRLEPTPGDATAPAPDLAGYVRFRPVEGSIALHLGMRPDLCGRGLGRTFLELVVPEARRRAAGRPVVLDVRRFNTRAIRLYRHVGFALVGGRSPTRDGQQLLRMMLRAECDDETVGGT